MAYRSSSKIATEASAASAAVPVPAGAAANDIAVVNLYMESGAAVTVPSGFTQKDDVPNNPTTQAREVVFWKRLTGADSGTYSFTWTGACWRAATCALFSGRITTGDPFTATNTADAGAAGRSVVVGAITAAAGDDLIGGVASYSGFGSTPTMTTLTVRQGVTGNDIAIGTQDAVSAGSTGARTFAYTGGSVGGMKGWLGALKAATSTTPVSTTRSISWDTDLAVAATRGVSFATEAVVPITRTASWNVASQVSVTRSLSWNTRLSVAATRAMSWTVKQAVAAARTVTWDVAGTLASVAITRTMSWAAEAQVAITRSLSWNTKTAVGPTRTASWVVKQLVARTRTLSWTTKSRTIATRTVSFNVKQSVGRTRVISYDVIVTVGGGVATIYVKGEGDTLQPATLVGVWDGTAVVPASIRSIT